MTKLPNNDVSSSLSELQDLKESGVQEAAELLASAFASSPAYLYVFEALTETQRLGALAWMFERNLQIFLKGGRAMCKCVFSNSSSSQEVAEMVCFFVLHPPGAVKFSTWDMVSHGLLTVPFRFGWQAFRRLLEVVDYHDEEDAQFFQSRSQENVPQATTKLWSLERMAVNPKWQGKGVGTKYLGSSIEGIKAKGQGIFLSTQEDRNVAFYSKLGFKTCRTKAYLTSKDGKDSTNTVMVLDELAADKP